MTRVGLLLAGLLVCSACAGTKPDADVAPAHPPVAAEPAPEQAATEPAQAVVEPAPAPPDDADVVIPSTKLDEYVTERAEGTYVHPRSGIAFPKQANGFVRLPTQRYDEEGNDVGIGYVRLLMHEGALYNVSSTIYVYPAERDADGALTPFGEQFDGEVASMRAKWTNARDVRSAETDSEYARRPVHVRAAEFESDGLRDMGKFPVSTSVVAFRLGPWHVTYRLSVPAVLRDESVAAFEKLLDALGLPRTGLAASTK